MIHLWLSLNISFLLASIILSTILYIREPTSKRWQLFFGASLLSIPAFVIDTIVVAFIHRLTPWDLDQFIFIYDKALGRPEYVIGQIYPSMPVLRAASEIAYTILPGAMTLVMAACFLFRPVHEAVRFVWTSVLVLALAPLLYVAFPACGPRFAFAGFPWDIPTFSVPHMVRLVATPNAIPSVHFAACLILLYFTRHWRIGIALACAYMLLVLWYVLGTGEHYLFDLFAAVPYTVGILWLTEPLPAESVSTLPFHEQAPAPEP